MAWKIVIIYYLDQLNEKNRAKKSLEQTVANMAKFLQDQSLSLLEKLDILGWDELADDCEELHELAEALHQKIREKFGLPPD